MRRLLTTASSMPGISDFANPAHSRKPAVRSSRTRRLCLILIDQRIVFSVQILS